MKPGLFACLPTDCRYTVCSRRTSLQQGNVRIMYLFSNSGPLRSPPKSVSGLALTGMLKVVE